MKNIMIALSVIFYTSISCSQPTAKKTEDMNTENPIPSKEQIVYVVDLHIFNPYELFVDDIKVDYEPVGANVQQEINLYLLKNGKHKIKIRFYQIPGDGLFSQKDMDRNSLSFMKYVKDDRQLKLVQELPLPNINVPVPFIDIEWEVEVTDLPYELKGWSQSRDLRTMDSTVLKQKVVAYYQKLWNILNEGDADTWTELTNKRTIETRVFDYTPVKQQQKLTKLNYDRALEAKGNMLPLEDYELKIYGNGRLVSLERNPTKEFQGYDENIKGEGVLIKKINSAIRFMPVKLHMPPAKKSFLADAPEWGDFEIIRK